VSLARLSVAKPVTVVMRILSLVLLGAICLTRLPVDLLPRVSLPTVAVNVTWPNVAPAEIEAQVTRPIEQAVSSVSNLYEVSSSTSEGRATIRVQFTWGTDVALAAVEVLQQVERARRSFPTDPTLQPPVVVRYDPSQMPILMLGVSGDADPVALRTLLEFCEVAADDSTGQDDDPDETDDGDDSQGGDSGGTTSGSIIIHMVCPKCGAQIF
jgi:HAE1 family hydrophobic/amphiphilic exporter-1